ncbi:hypothetical protein ACFYTC_18980 [Actinomadura nitritigenes]|uniref:hypothetical protein n=1 Tax=Actinomadura nitritigenes TaxID=134602 RepID=UPI0036809B08
MTSPRCDALPLIASMIGEASRRIWTGPACLARVKTARVRTSGPRSEPYTTATSPAAYFPPTVAPPTGRTRSLRPSPLKSAVRAGFATGRACGSSGTGATAAGPGGTGSDRAAGPHGTAGPAPPSTTTHTTLMTARARVFMDPRP